ncbi:unnamed protein product [Rangifer tarandus platyrhynchus]|uniref:Uncharacterized protein n=1 Tax=Rangifer tarandus platyrhynchus TaxID=3082113 RepID=A0AC59YD01_RANTA
MAPGCRPLLPPDIRALEGEEDEPGEEMGVKQRVRSASGDRAAKADEWRPRGDGALLGCPSRGDECGRQAADRGWRPGGRPQAANAEGSQEPPQGSDQERGQPASRACSWSSTQSWNGLFTEGQAGLRADGGGQGWPLCSSGVVLSSS